MPIFETWDIVKVPFPYTNRPVRQRRPALVIADGTLTVDGRLLWVLMITSAENRGWVGDVEISEIGSAGLPVPSIVRAAKIATIESGDAEFLGKLPISDRLKVTENLSRQLSKALP
jgi:mRNA interferase MazF